MKPHHRRAPRSATGAPSNVETGTRAWTQGRGGPSAQHGRMPSNGRNFIRSNRRRSTAATTGTVGEGGWAARTVGVGGERAIRSVQQFAEEAVHGETPDF